MKRLVRNGDQRAFSSPAALAEPPPSALTIALAAKVLGVLTVTPRHCEVTILRKSGAPEEGGGNGRPSSSIKTHVSYRPLTTAFGIFRPCQTPRGPSSLSAPTEPPVALHGFREEPLPVQGGGDRLPRALPANSPPPETKCVATKIQLFLQEAIPADSGRGGNRTRRALTLSLCALMVGADQAGILVLRVVDQVVKGQLPEELRVGPGVAVVRVLPIRLFSAVYEIGRNTAT